MSALSTGEPSLLSRHGSRQPYLPASPHPSLPLVKPQPPLLSQHALELAEIEDSGIFSNYGPINTRLERELVAAIFKAGECVTVCNATIGLMLAIREVIGENRAANRRYALMPSFTFAATAHAALWCGLTPLLCDIDPKTWLPDEASEEALLQQYAGEIAVVVPYATFGNNLDLQRYQTLSERHEVPIVVDAAASLGSIDQNGQAFGSGFAWPVVFSMHATKAFSVGEGGILYCADRERMARLRQMGSFGFGQPRSATMLGLNAKLTEVGALTALLALQELPGLVQQRAQIARLYHRALHRSFDLQQRSGDHQVRAFQSVLLPKALSGQRSEIMHRLASINIGAGAYFSPHLAEQPYFQAHAVAGPLPVTNDVAGRVLSLPLYPGMTASDVARVAGGLRAATAGVLGSATSLHKMTRSPEASTDEPPSIALERKSNTRAETPSQAA